MSDSTETVRRELVPTMSDEAALAIARNEPTWTTDELTADFEVLGFAAPLVVVRRKADGALGSLMFNHRPRVYFGWSPHE